METDQFMGLLFTQYRISAFLTPLATLVALGSLVVAVLRGGVRLTSVAFLLAGLVLTLTYQSMNMVNSVVTYKGYVKPFALPGVVIIVSLVGDWGGSLCLILGWLRLGRELVQRKSAKHK